MTKKMDEFARSTGAAPPEARRSRAVALRMFAVRKLWSDIAGAACEVSQSRPRLSCPRLAPAGLADDDHASRAGEMFASRSPDRR
jgi:hypothetical protein